MGNNYYNGTKRNQNNNSKKERNENTKNQHDKISINSRNIKPIYSDEEIARARYIDSKAKFLVRDRIHNDNINTRNKWIAINNLKVKDKWDRNGKYIPDILSFDAEIFDRTEQPKYDEDMSEDKKHLLTYVVAEGDIEKQRKIERKKHQKIDRPCYHVDVTTKRTSDGKTEYQVKNIKQRKKDYSKYKKSNGAS